MQDLRHTKRYFDTKIVPNIGDLEKKFEAQNKTIFIYIISILVAVAGGFIEFYALTFLGLFVAAIVMFTQRGKSAEIKKEFNQKLVEPLLKSIDPKLKYDGTKEFSQSKFTNSLLFNKYQSYESEHLISYPLENNTIEMAHINAYTKIKGLDEDDEDTIETIFEGLFGMVNTTRKIKGQVCIFPDLAEKHLGFVGQSFQDKSHKHLQKVKLDDPRFEKEFIVYASDQVTANYVLTHTVMEALTRFTKENKQRIYLSFVNDKIYIGLSLSLGFFQPVLKEKLSDFSNYRKSLKTFYLLLEILKTLQEHHRL